MFSKQREIRQVVVETNIRLPRRLAVALAAAISKLTLVRIVVAMTPDAA